MKNIASFLPATTNRLIIRQINSADQADYFEIFGSSFISRYDDYEPITFNEAKNNIEDINQGYINQSCEQEYAVEEPNSHKMIGVLYIHIGDESVAIGYHFNQQFHGKGYALETLQCWIPILKSCFEKQIKALVHPDNEPSKRLLRKIGFNLHCSRILPDTNTPEEEYVLD